MKEEIRQLEAPALLTRGRILASGGDWNGALSNFQKAVGLNPELHFKPTDAARHLAAPALVAKGRNLARAQDRNGAIASFRQANELDPGLIVHPEAEADRWAAKSFVAKGITLADLSDIDGATEAFQEATRLDSARDVERTTKETTALRHAGDSLARSGDVDGAIKAFEEAVVLDPILRLDPRKEVAASLVKKGTSEAKDDEDGAIKTFQKAVELDPSLKLNPEVEAYRPAADRLLVGAKQLVRQNKVTEAVQAYSEAITAYGRIEGLDPDGSIRAGAWNDLCWEASLRRHPVEVMDACEHAVHQAEPLQRLSWMTRDSRGVARALTGNTQGAIEDFQFYVDRADDKQKKLQRQKWIDDLSKKEKPDEALKSILIP